MVAPKYEADTSTSDTDLSITAVSWLVSGASDVLTGSTVVLMVGGKFS